MTRRDLASIFFWSGNTLEYRYVAKLPVLKGETLSEEKLIRIYPDGFWFSERYLARMPKVFLLKAILDRKADIDITEKDLNRVSRELFNIIQRGYREGLMSTPCSSLDIH